MRGGLLNRILQYLRALAAQCQPTEDGMQQFIAGFDVSTAVGAPLGVIGRLVGQARGTFDDTSYRRLIRARVSVNKSNGTIEDLLRIARGVLNDDGADLVVEPQYPAALAFRVGDIEVTSETASLLFNFLRAAASAGVRLIVETSPAIPSQTLFLGDEADPGSGIPGLGDSSDLDVGGRLSSALA